MSQSLNTSIFLFDTMPDRADYKHQWYEENRKRIAAMRHEYYEDNKETIKVKEREYYALNKNVIKERNLANKKKLRNERAKLLKEIFGDVCQVCGYSEHPEILEYHHIIPLFKTGKSRKPAIDVVALRPQDFVHVCPNCHALKDREQGVRSGYIN